MTDYPTLWASEKDWARSCRDGDRLMRRIERQLRRRTKGITLLGDTYDYQGAVFTSTANETGEQT